MANIGICVGCGATKTLKIKGACAACYQQFKRTGSYTRERQPRGMCTVEGCNKPAHGKGMCGMHLKRLKVSGSLDDPRADNINLMTNQALYAQWSSYRRKGAYPIVQEWYDSFAVFMDGVGNRPSALHRLYRLDKNKPMGPGNFEWREKMASVRTAEETPTEYAARHRTARRALHGTTVWSNELVRKYGLTLERYVAMLDEQKGCCAICNHPETLIKNGTLAALAVDHDHTTGKVRALLCNHCNNGLGKFKDDPKLLQAAIAYLAKHAAP